MSPIALDGLTVRYGQRLALDQVSLAGPGRVGLRPARQERRRQVVARALPAGGAEARGGPGPAARPGRLAGAGVHPLRGGGGARGPERAAGDDGAPALPLLLPALSALGRRRGGGAAQAVRRAGRHAVRQALQGAEGAGLAGSRARQLAAPAGARRSHAGARRGGAEGGLRGADRRSRRPRDDGVHHHPRPRGRRADRRPGGDPGARGGSCSTRRWRRSRPGSAGSASRARRRRRWGGWRRWRRSPWPRAAGRSRRSSRGYDEGSLPVEDSPEVTSLTLEEIFIALTGAPEEGER